MAEERKPNNPNQQEGQTQPETTNNPENKPPMTERRPQPFDLNPHQRGFTIPRKRLKAVSG